MARSTLSQLLTLGPILVSKAACTKIKGVGKGVWPMRSLNRHANDKRKAKELVALSRSFVGLN